MKSFAKTTAFVATVLTIGVASNGCNDNPAASKATQPQQTGPAWSLDYVSVCPQNTDPTQWVGAYGFKVNADGSFQVGPTPQGEVYKGKLETEDFAELTQIASGVVDGTAVLSAESCNGYYGNVADYTLTVDRHGKKSEVLHKTEENLCSSELAADAAEKLHNEILALADKYYPTPFPDTCLDAAAAVKALYPSVQHCTADADCGYLTPDYAPIQANTVDQVFVDNCSVVEALPAANLSAIGANQAKLTAALEKAQQVCGGRIARSDCQNPRSFASSAAPAVCKQGVCSVNPSLGF